MTKEVRIRKLHRRTKIVDGHWLWIGGLDRGGYGKTSYLDRSIRINRLSAHLFLDLDLDSPLLALHKTTCNYKNCWNPDCLYIGTHTDNMNDKRSIGKCPKCGRDYDREYRFKLEGRTMRSCRNCHTIAKRLRRRELRKIYKNA